MFIMGAVHTRTIASVDWIWPPIPVPRL